MLLLLWKYNHSTIPCAGSSAASRVWLSIEGFWVDKGGHDKDKPNKYNASRVEMSLQFVAKYYVVVVSSLASLASDENLCTSMPCPIAVRVRPIAISHKDKL